MCGLVGLSVHRKRKFGQIDRNVTGGADPAVQWQNPLPAAALRFEITKLNRSNRENRDGPTFWRAGGTVAKRPCVLAGGWHGGQEVPRSGGRAGRWPSQDFLGSSFLRCSVFF